MEHDWDLTAQILCTTVSIWWDNNLLSRGRQIALLKFPHSDSWTTSSSLIGENVSTLILKAERVLLILSITTFVRLAEA